MDYVTECITMSPDSSEVSFIRCQNQYLQYVKSYNGGIRND